MGKDIVSSRRNFYLLTVNTFVSPSLCQTVFNVFYLNYFIHTVGTFCILIELLDTYCW